MSTWLWLLASLTCGTSHFEVHQRLVPILARINEPFLNDEGMTGFESTEELLDTQTKAYSMLFEYVVEAAVGEEAADAIEAAHAYLDLLQMLCTPEMFRVIVAVAKAHIQHAFSPAA